MLCARYVCRPMWWATHSHTQHGSYVYRMCVCVPSVNIVQCVRLRATTQAKRETEFTYVCVRVAVPSVCVTDFVSQMSAHISRSLTHSSPFNLFHFSLVFLLSLILFDDSLLLLFSSADLLIFETVTKFYTFTADRCLASTFLSQTTSPARHAAHTNRSQCKMIIFWFQIEFGKRTVNTTFSTKISCAETETETQSHRKIIPIPCVCNSGCSDKQVYPLQRDSWSLLRRLLLCFLPLSRSLVLSFFSVLYAEYASRNSSLHDQLHIVRHTNDVVRPFVDISRRVCVVYALISLFSFFLFRKAHTSYHRLVVCTAAEPNSVRKKTTG